MLAITRIPRVHGEVLLTVFVSGRRVSPILIRDYPGEIKCGRAGQYRIERYGADMRLPDLCEEIAQCSRQGKTHDACMVRYRDLVSTRVSQKDALVVGRTRPGQASARVNRDLSVDGAKILVMRLREIGRGRRQAEWVNGNGGGFADGRFN